MTEQEFLDSYRNRADVVHVSDPIGLDAAKEAARDAVKAARRRRIEVTRTDAAGALLMFYVDYGLLPAPDGRVVLSGAGQAQEPARPSRLQPDVEAWLAANVASADVKIRSWKIVGADEGLASVRVRVVYDDGTSFSEKDFIAIKPAGRAIEFRPMTTEAVPAV